MANNYHTLATARQAVQDAIKDTGGKKSDLINAMINIVYLGEVLKIQGSNKRPLYWMLDQVINRRSLSPVAISGITADNPAVISVPAGHGHVAGNRISLFNVSGMTEINGMMATVASAGATSVTTDIDSSAFTAYASGGYVYHQGIKLTTAVDSILSAGWNGQSTPFVPITPQISDYGNLAGSDIPGTYYHLKGTTGLPKSYIHTQSFDGSGGQADYLTWFPASDQSYLLRYWNVKIADRLSADTDVPLLPTNFHEVLVSGAVSRLLEAKDAQLSVEDMSMWPQIYQLHLESIRKFNDEWWDKAETSMGSKPFMS